jgi:O-antigen ligase
LKNITKEEKPIYFVGFFLILLIVLITSIGPYFGIQQLVLFAYLPLMFIIAIISFSKSKNEVPKEFIAYCLVVCTSLTTVYYYVDYEQFGVSFRGLLATVMASFIPIGLNPKKGYSDFFHLGYILSILCLIAIEYILGNFNLSGFAEVRASRGRFYYNANYYSYISFFANFSLFYLHLKYRKLITLIPLLVIPILLIILSFITQSRSGLLFILLLNGIFWFFIFKSQKNSYLIKVTKPLLIITISIFLSLKLIDIYNHSQIKNRVSDTADESRGALVIEGLEVFSDNILLGVGLGQFPSYSRYGQFTHNSYAEILAEQGIIGGIILMFFFGRPLFISLLNFKKDKKNPYYKLNLLFIVSFLLYNNAYVFYKFSYSMMYFFLFIGLQNYYSQINKENINNVN